MWTRRAWLSALPAGLWAWQRPEVSKFEWAAKLTGAAQGPGAPLALWYRQPARSWNEALPVGNGRLGAMVFGGVESERLQLNEDSLWEGFPRDTVNPQALDALPRVRELLFAGKELEATELAAKTMMGRPERIKSYQPAGDLWIEMPGIAEASDYRRSLDLDTAIATTEFTSGGVRYTREVLASEPAQVILIRLAASRAGALNFRVLLSRLQDAACRTEGGGLTLSGQIKTEGGEGLRFTVRAEVSAPGGVVQPTGEAIDVRNATEAVIRVAIATSYREKSPEAAVRRHINGSGGAWSDRRAQHIADHQALFRRLTIDLPAAPEATTLPTDARLERIVKDKAIDPGLEALHFQFGRYLLIASSRPGALPANLQGVWNEHLNAPWNSDYHTNINIQMNYWLAGPANLKECELPLFDWMDSIVKSGERTAQVHYGARGWVVHHLSNIFGFTTPADGIWGVWPMGAAWLARHPWEHYLYTRDREFLAKRGYPLMKGAARFILDFLVEAPAGTPVAGRLVPSPSHSPENRFRKADGTVAMFTYAATMDVELCWDVLRNTAAAARELNIDPEFRAECERALTRLPELKVSPRGGKLQEWVEDYDEPEPRHRHVSHLYALHPGDQISLTTTPALAEACRKTLEARGDTSTGWSTAWKMNFWARLRDGARAHSLFQMLLQRCTLPNLFDSHPPFQIDGNFGAVAGVCEMLLQSHAGEIHLLPALPPAWPRGRVAGMRARGGFELDFSWDQGRLTHASLLSTVGGPARLRLPGRESLAEIATEPGRRYDILKG
ncbi:MAG: glycoside hydrolase N-terminal domain-containing protein [Bryobacteraceae bacterium]|nr:glycoside hydrolase N-terminal domain-containing protein [Bryobacteraceae bacterium]